MRKKFSAVALAALAFGVVPQSNAGTDIVRDLSGQVRPPPLYCPPPPVAVVYPTYVYAPVRVFGFERFVIRRVHCPPRWH
jgi:hypothetical protein